MKLKRRSFLGLAVKLSVASSIPAVLTACGGGGGSGSSSGTVTASASSVDKSLAAVDEQQAVTSSQHSQSTGYHSEIASGTTNSSSAAKSSMAATSSLLDASPSVQAQAIYGFFAQRTPDYSNSALLSQGAHYLLVQSPSLSAEEFWQAQSESHGTAYTQYLHQVTKLKAVARLFDSKIQTANISSNPAMQKDTAMLIQQLEPAAVNLIDQLKNTVASLANGLTLGALDTVLSILTSIYEYMEQSIKDTLQRWIFNLAANLAIDTMLEQLAKQSITNLNFSDRESVMFSLAKITVASLAIMGASQIQEVEAVTSDAEKELLELLLSSSDLSAKMSMLWLSLMNQVMDSTFTSMQSAAMSSDTFDPETDNWALDQATLVTLLQQNSALLAILGLIVKALFTVFQDQALNDSSINEQSFSTDSTADMYSILFASAQNENDQDLTAFTTENENMDTFMSAFSGLFASLSSPESANLFDTLTSALQTSVSSTGGTAIEMEENAYNFALQLAEYAYLFTSQTESDAAAFATHMADLAYSFTMDIEEDAYQFAMQGMEYGYLFASRGEEVGVMADRILWMAVQIGVMADRIGEMADRIVYTEHMIVYTEILILDFGILIYGTMKQITNLILTGMALILDREWYEPSSEDAVLNMINGNITIMLENMNEYSLNILEQQQALRELTLKALDTVNFAET